MSNQAPGGGSKRESNASRATDAPRVGNTFGDAAVAPSIPHAGARHIGNPESAFEILGLPRCFALSVGQLEARQRELGKALHPDRYTSAPAGERRAALSKAIAVNDAVRALKDPVKRGQILLECLVGRAVSDEPASQSLLMEMMQVREELAEAKGRRDTDAVQQLGRRISERERDVVAKLEVSFQTLADSVAAPNLEREIQSHLGELRYLQRFSEEVARIEDELD